MTRAAQKHCTNPIALEEARKTVRRVVELDYPLQVQQGTTELAALTVAQGRAHEAFDRAYCRARLLNHGTDIDRHPEFHTYQYF